MEEEMAGPRPICWLQLSDLHLGCRGEDLWWQVQEELETSIRSHVERLGPPDLLLISGDLTNTGAHEQFDRVDQLLDTLLAWLPSEPIIVAVPGNHDLQRPQGLAALPYRVLEKYAQGLADEDVRLVEEAIWDQQDSAFIEPLFAEYQAWFRRRLLPNLQRCSKIHTSHFPGDCCLEIEIAGAFPLCLVGLNSTWQQYKGGEFEGKLAIPGRQFQAALPPVPGGSPLDVFKRQSRSLLMLHQPPDWLSKNGRRTFNELIYPSDRFDLCLFGHMHEGRTESIAISGGKPRYFFQAPSLFGLEHYGTSQEERVFGYAWGKLSEDGEVRIWPLKYIRRGGGEGAFVHDDNFPEEPTGVLIRSVNPQAHSALPTVRSADFRAYLEGLVDRTDHINISGISSAGNVKGALRYPIEKLYTPLRSRNSLTEGPVVLPNLLPRYSRLLLEGQPGAGKTTFLRLVACMLARDALKVECPGGGSWRNRYLGFWDEKPRIPVLLRIADLLPLLTEDSARFRYDDRRWLLDLLELMCTENEYHVDRDSWRCLLEEGHAVLLLDGLDEVTDDRLRERVFVTFRDACKSWKCSIVVTSRPIQTAALQEMGFYAASIELFGDAEIGTFIDHWITALHAVDNVETTGSERERYRGELLSAICDYPRVRRLASNPVMLTCLCVVHWNEGRLPEGRSRVYRAVLKWLVASRTKLREAEGFTDRFAWNAFALLAFAMSSSWSGKKAVFSLEDAAIAVDSAVRRQFPGLASTERRHEARRWLAFECLGSGIVEELPLRRIRFWHLTFQEFLTALQLAWYDDRESSRNSWWPIIRHHLTDTQWREIIDLFPGCLLDEGGEARVDQLVERVMALRGQEGDLLSEARVAGIVRRLLQTLTAYQYRPHPEVPWTYENALKHAMSVFAREDSLQIPISIRIEVAAALGRGGDPRLAPECDNFLAVANLTAFGLGKFPVTVEEYQRFVESGGYNDPSYWSLEGWEHCQKEGWQTPGGWVHQLERPNRPVTGVSWYEANSYCCWVSKQRGGEARLPTESEWEQAAGWPHGHFPWGNERPNSERANFDRHIGAPTPVGIYPNGDGQFGHCDLAGNVWEWCADMAGSQEGRTCRGGGWSNPAESLRANFGVKYWPGFRGNDVGFRVAVLFPNAANPGPPDRQ